MFHSKYNVDIWRTDIQKLQLYTIQTSNLLQLCCIPHYYTVTGQTTKTLYSWWAIKQF